MKHQYTFTKQARTLFKALQDKGLNVKSEYWDKHKHVDIAIEPAKLYIEIDGLHHYTDPKQIEADFKRDHYSNNESFDTIRIPNTLIDHHLDEIAEAFTEVILKRLQDHSKLKD